MVEENPWFTKTTKIVYENPWIRVDENQVINPNGGEGIYGTVNFKNVAIGIIPIDDKLNTWLVGQFRYPLNDYSWEIPEGGCPNGENWEETARRELKEETGIVAKSLINISKVHTSNSVCSEVGYIFIAEGLTFSEAEPEDTEVLKLKKIPLKVAYEMVLQNNITDSLSVIGILKAAKLKGII